MDNVFDFPGGGPFSPHALGDDLGKDVGVSDSPASLETGPSSKDEAPIPQVAGAESSRGLDALSPLQKSRLCGLLESFREKHIQVLFFEVRNFLNENVGDPVLCEYIRTKFLQPLRASCPAEYILFKIQSDVFNQTLGDLPDDYRSVPLLRDIAEEFSQNPLIAHIVGKTIERITKPIEDLDDDALFNMLSRKRTTSEEKVVWAEIAVRRLPLDRLMGLVAFYTNPSAKESIVLIEAIKKKGGVVALTKVLCALIERFSVDILALSASGFIIDSFAKEASSSEIYTMLLILNDVVVSKGGIPVWAYRSKHKAVLRPLFEAIAEKGTEEEIGRTLALGSLDPSIEKILENARVLKSFKKQLQDTLPVV